MAINGYKVSFEGDANVVRLIVVIVVQLCDYTKTIDLYTLSRWLCGMLIISQ